MSIGNASLEINKSPYGGFWKRGIAVTIDFLIIEMIVLVNGLLFFSGEYIFFRTILTVDDITKFKPLIQIINQVFVITMFILMNFYFIYMHGKYGSTIGKMLLRLKVVRTDYTPINYKIALIRHLGFLLSIPTFNLGFLLAAFDSKKQSLHDKIAKTYVIKST